MRRVTRGLVLGLKQQEYVAAARLRAESTLYIMLVELLPNCRSLLIVDGCLRIGYTIITIGILGFLGLGLPPPNPDWGGMVKESTTVLTVWPLMFNTGISLGPFETDAKIQTRLPFWLVLRLMF